MPCVYLKQMGRDIPSKLIACRKFAEGDYSGEIGPGGGFFTLANNILPEGNRQQAECFNELQKIAIEKTRLGIPLLQSEEGTHGAMCSGKTVFPEGLALGSSWDMDLMRRMYSTAAAEARAVGIHQLYTLVVEPNRDPRMGRNEEGFGEDPFLCARIAESIADGAQGNDVSNPTTLSRDSVIFLGKVNPSAAWSAEPWRFPNVRCGRCFFLLGSRASKPPERWVRWPPTPRLTVSLRTHRRSY